MKKSYFLVLVIIVIALLGVNIFFLIDHKNVGCKNKQEEKSVNCNCYVSETLSLDHEQSKKYELIKQNHQTKASKIIDSLHINQEVLMDYLASNENDSLKVIVLENKITEFQKELLKQHIEQYKELKTILKPKQIVPMNNLFKTVFVCRPSCNHRKACAAEKE